MPKEIQERKKGKKDRITENCIVNAKKEKISQKTVENNQHSRSREKKGKTKSLLQWKSRRIVSITLERKVPKR